MSLRPTWSTQRVSGQQGTCREALGQKESMCPGYRSSRCKESTYIVWWETCPFLTFLSGMGPACLRITPPPLHCLSGMGGRWRMCGVDKAHFLENVSAPEGAEVLRCGQCGVLGFTFSLQSVSTGKRRCGSFQRGKKKTRRSEL